MCGSGPDLDDVKCELYSINIFNKKLMKKVEGNFMTSSDYSIDK